MAWASVVGGSQSWTTVTNSAATWSAAADTAQSWTAQAFSVATWTATGPPSVASRLNRIFPQSESTLYTPGDVDFIHRVKSEGHFFISTGNMVYIRSAITQGI